jgi:hypothetical protein
MIKIGIETSLRDLFAQVLSMMTKIQMKLLELMNQRLSTQIKLMLAASLKTKVLIQVLVHFIFIIESMGNS